MQGGRDKGGKCEGKGRKNKNEKGGIEVKGVK